MLKGKLKIKEAVDYFDANYVLKELEPHFSGSYDHPDFFRLYICAIDGFGNLCKKELYHSRSFAACKRHLKADYLRTDIGSSLLFFRIDSFKRHVLKDEWISTFDYVVKFNFERHESLCNV